ncbi:T9SS type A sorting domain-containing protein, partial [Bacteroidota bacterium]
GSFDVTYYNGFYSVTETVSRSPSFYSAVNIDTLEMYSIREIDGCEIGIVNMGKLFAMNVSYMFGAFRNTDAIVFDIRNYPNETLWTIVDYIYTDPIHMANFTTPDIEYPGRLYWRGGTIGVGTDDPYTGKIVILFDERTQSQAEYTCMGLEQYPGAIKIGSTTAGADGNVSKVYLPGNVYTWFTGLGVFYPDYTETQRVGIIPHKEVLPTIEGVRNGIDEVMEAAFDTITSMFNKVTFSVNDGANPLDSVCIKVNNKNKYTNISGIVDIALETGEYEYIVSKIGYSQVIDTLYVTTEQSVEITLVLEEYDLTFNIFDNDSVSPVEASVTIDGIAKTAINGSCTFNDLIFTGNKGYEIRNEGYKTINEDLFLHSDSTVNVIMQLSTKNNIIIEKDITIYPNPAKGFLKIDISQNFNQMNMCIVDLTGKILIRRQLNFPNNLINISNIPKGLYIIKINMDETEINKKLIIE